MTPAETGKLAVLVSGAYAGYFAAKIGPREAEAMVLSYRELLADLDYRPAYSAVVALCGLCKFPPSIAEIRAEYFRRTTGGRRSGLLAWEDANRAARTRGVRQTPGVDFDFKDPLVTEAVRAVGWQEICHADTSAARNSNRARFVEVYDQLADAAVRDVVTASLPGATPIKALPRGTRTLADVIKLLPAATRGEADDDEPGEDPEE